MNRVRTLVIVLAAFGIAACSTTAPKATPAPAAKPAPAAAPAAGAGPNVAGNWTLSIQTPMGARDSTLVLQQNGATLSGTMQSPRGEVPINGTINGKEVAFTMNVNVQGQDMKIDYAGTVENDAMKGKVVLGQFGEGTWSGKRKQ
jgi:hypothetical protein